MNPITVPMRTKGLKLMAALHATLSVLFLGVAGCSLWLFILEIVQWGEPGDWLGNSQILWIIRGVLLFLLMIVGVIACFVTVPTLVWVLSTLGRGETTGLIISEDGLDIRVDPFTRRIGLIPWSEIAFIEYKPMTAGYSMHIHFVHPEKYAVQSRTLDPVVGPVGLFRQGRDGLARTGLPLYTALFESPDAQLCASMAEVSRGRTATRQIGLSQPWDLQ
ncbi:MAG: hypothetical protein LBN10_10325 [Propionibacteriaceae bacterium]|jgi:hypothetical protein|nr:hypothetical protein [Propionibacteriaceae bacterium]